MNILFFSKVLYPKIGGYVSSASNLIKGLSQISNVNLLLNDESLNSFELEENKRLFQVSNVFNLIDGNLEELHKVNKFDAVFFNSTNESDYLYKRFKKLNIPLIVYEHQVPLADELLEEFLDRIRTADLSLVPSESLQLEIQLKYGIDVEVVNLPIDTDLFRRKPYYEIPGVSENDHVLLTVCMIKPVRNIEMLLHVIKDITRYEKNIKLLIVGEVPFYVQSNYLDELKNLISVLRLEEYIIFLGKESDAELLAKIHSRADLYVDTSMSETFGLAKAEALSCENFVVTFDIGNNLSLIGEENIGYLCTDKDSMVQVIRKLLNNHQLRGDLGRKGRQHVIRNYSINVTSQKLKEKIYSVL